MPLGGYRPVPYIFRKFFSRATVASKIAYLSLEAFKSYLASELIMLENIRKIRKMQHIWPYQRRLSSAYGELPPRVIHFYRAMRCISAVFAVMQCLSVCPSVCLSLSVCLSRSWITSKRI